MKMVFALRSDTGVVICQVDRGVFRLHVER